MRTLLSTLTAEQKKPSRRPYLKVEVQDYIGSVPRLRFATVYSAAEPAGPHAVAVPADGTINRLRVDPSTNICYHARGGPGAYGSWVSFRTTTKLCALAQYGANLLAFAVDSGTPTQIYWCTSPDNGASWGAWALLTTAAGSVTYIAATAKTSGDTLLIWAVGATVYKMKRVSAVWGAAAAWTNTVASVTGLAVAYRLDFNVIVTGTAPTTLDPTVYQTMYGDGYSAALDTWGALYVITEAMAGSGVAYTTPFLLYSSATGVHRATYRETFAGPVAYDRTMFVNQPWANDFVDHRWSEPTPFDLDHDYGLALAQDPTTPYTYIWATTPHRVYRAPSAPAALDVTADVLSCIAVDEPFSPNGAIVRLRNDDGRYNSPGVGALANLSLGARLDISPGYYCTNLPNPGPQASLGPSYQIESIEHFAPQGTNHLVIRATSMWGALQRWRPGRTYRWPTSNNYYQIVAAIAAKRHLTISALSSTPKYTDDFPDFAITPGYDPPPYIVGYEWRWQRGHPVPVRIPIWYDPPPLPGTLDLPAFSNALAALMTLYSHLEDRTYIRGAHLYSLWPQAADASAYSYGGDHPIRTAVYRSLAPDNRFAAAGLPPLIAEQIDYTGSELLHDRPRVRLDINMTTAADVTDRAAREARDATMFAQCDTIVVPVNCGQELWDVVDITDPRVGLAAAKRRVIGLTLVYSAKEPIYHHVLTLGNP